MTPRHDGAVNLLRAAHLGPTLAVTTVSGLLAWSLHLSLPACLAAVGVGQVQVGWLNDLLDRARDQMAGRTEKPVAAGTLSVAAVRTAIVAATIAVVPLSFIAFGHVGGLAHLVAVLSAQSYNIYWKFTVLSWLPYAVSFALLPSALLLAANFQRPWQLAPAGALLGVAAHLANVVRDIEVDLATGVHGLPQRIGAKASTRLAIALLIVVALLLFSDPHLIALLVVAAIALALLPPPRLLFAGLVGLAILDVLLLLDSLQP